MRRFGLIVGLFAILTTLVTCDTDRVFPGEELTSVPAGAVGVVSIGAMQIPKASAGQALMFAFDETGRLLGKVEGPGIEGNGVLAAGRELVAPSHGSATRLTPTGKRVFELPGFAVSAATFDRETGTATLWFEHRGEGGFVSLASDNSVRTGKVGDRLSMLRTAADCGGRQFAIIDILVKFGEPVPNTLYEVLPDGTVAVRATFDVPADFGPLSRVSTCIPDGQSILSIYHSARSGADVLVRTSLVDGARTQTQLDRAGEIRKGSLTVVSDRLYWLSFDGNAYSVALNGDTSVDTAWTLPGDAKKVSAAVNGTTASVVDRTGTPTFSQYNLVTGVRTRGPIELPWLEPIVGSAVGNTFYAISGVAGLE